MEELTKEKIVSSSVVFVGPPKKKPTIYFLLHDGEIVYVGQTFQSVYGRLADHQKSGKLFDSFSVFEVEGCPNETEAFYIIKFLPKYNRNVPDQDVWKTINFICEISGETPGRLRRKLAKKGVLPIGHLKVYSVEKVREAGVEI